MLRRTIMALALGLALTACSTDATRNNSLTGPGAGGGPAITELRGVLELEDDGDINLLSGGHPVRLVGISAAVAEQLNGVEVLVAGRMEGEAFLVAMVRAVVADVPEDPGTPADPTVRMP
jgi:hypothetical protein